MCEKEFYTTKELAEAPWFPASAEETITKYVKQNLLKGVNVSATGKTRYHIYRDSVIKYLGLSEKDFKDFVKKVEKKHKKLKK